MTRRFRRPEVKICGTTTEVDLRISIAAGADAVGIICPPHRGSRHSVVVEQAVRLVRSASPAITTVLIPRLTDPQKVIGLARSVAPDRLQLGETEDIDLLRTVVEAAVVPEVAQVVHVGDRAAVERAAGFAAVADIIHLDTVGDRPGGTGRTHDWSISREITETVHAFGKPVILAGGLTPGNVAEAVATVRPDGVDVESGTKGAGTAHDRSRVETFVAAAGAAFEKLPAAS